MQQYTLGTDIQYVAEDTSLISRWFFLNTHFALSAMHAHPHINWVSMFFGL